MSEVRIDQDRQSDVLSAWRSYASTPFEHTYDALQLAQMANILGHSPHVVHQYGAGMAFAEAAQKSTEQRQAEDLLEQAESFLAKAFVIAEQTSDKIKMTRYCIALGSLQLYNYPLLSKNIEHLDDILHNVRAKLIELHSYLIRLIRSIDNKNQSSKAMSFLHELVVLISLLESPNMTNGLFVPYHSFPWQNAKKYYRGQQVTSPNFDIGIYSLQERKTKYKIDVKSRTPKSADENGIIIVSVQDLLRHVKNERPELYGTSNPPAFADTSVLDPDVLAISSQYITSRFKKTNAWKTELGQKYN